MNKLVFDAFDHYTSSYNKDRQGVDRAKYNDVCDKFLKSLDDIIGLHHVGPNWINLYLIWSFDYWRTKDDVKFGKKLHFSKVFSKAGLKRFLDRAKDFNWYMAKKNLGISTFKVFEESERFDRRSLYQSFKTCYVNDLRYNGGMTCLMCPDRKICKKVCR